MLKDDAHDAILLLSHSTGFSSTALHALFRFFSLKPQTTSIVQILHPLDDPDQPATITVGADPPKKYFRPPPRSLKHVALVRHAWHFFVGFFAVNCKSTSTTLAIGLNPLNAAVLIICRFFLGRPQTVIFFSCDYSETRFPSPFTSMLYVYIDAFARYFADRTWNVSPRMQLIAHKESRIAKRQMLVANGVSSIFGEPDRVKYEAEPVTTIQFVYIGSLEPGKGLEVLIEALGSCAIVHEWRLTVIGDGSLKHALISRAADLGLLQRLHFSGFIPNEHIHDFLARMHVGFAPYTSTPSYNYYCDPVKVKDYLASGVFTIVSDIPWIGSRLEQLGIGHSYSSQLHLRDVITTTVGSLIGQVYDREQVFQTARGAGLVPTWHETFTDGLSGLS